jgi:uncharacterized protein YlxW (UPF0749 family)
MKRNTSKVTILILTFFLGFLAVMQIRILRTGVKYVSFSDIEELTIQTESVLSENLRLSERVSILTTQINDFEDSIESSGNIEAVIADELEYYKIISGAAPLGGPGVIIIVSDSERELLQDENPNNLLVHDLDIEALITDLHEAGAEAIAINGQRVLADITRVVCNGPTLRINGEFYSQPFIIEAIGNKKFLEAAINAPDKYGHILRQWGLFIEVNTTVYLEIPAYEELVDYQYMKPKEN